MRRTRRAAIEPAAEDARATLILARLELEAAQTEVDRLQVLIHHGEPLPFWMWRHACERLARAQQAMGMVIPTPGDRSS